MNRFTNRRYMVHRPIPPGNRSAQNPAHGGPADLQPSGDLGFAGPGTMQFPDFRSVCGRGCRPAQSLAVRARMRQTGPGPFPQNLPFELREDGQQSGHGSTRRRGQVQCLGQGNKPDTQMLQFLERRQQVRD